MPDISKFLNKSFGIYNIHGVSVEPTYWMAGAIVILIFLLILTLARMRYLYIEWHFDRHNLSFLFYGFLLALILEGFLLISGRTFITEMLGWENAPKPIGTALDIGRDKLVQVLGEETKVPSSNAQTRPTVDQLMNYYGGLEKNDAEKVRSQICKP